MITTRPVEGGDVEILSSIQKEAFLPLWEKISRFKQSLSTWARR